MAMAKLYTTALILLVNKYKMMKMERVICIDDDPLCLLLGEVVLKQTDFAKETILLESGLAALSILNNLYSTGDKQLALQKQKPSTLIFLDINMPVMNGWEFLDAFEKNYHHLMGQIRIIILSSSIDTADIIKSRQYDTVSDYIPKPLTIDGVNKLKSVMVA
jgi:CheY-like chemotaxis protein